MGNLRKLRRSAEKGSEKMAQVHFPPGEAIVVNSGNPDVGAINGYHCRVCGKITMVQHVDAGTTPMFLACRSTEGCEGQAVSLGYPKGPVPPRLAAAVKWEWYKPKTGDRILKNPEMKDYVKRGGLALRERKE